MQSLSSPSHSLAARIIFLTALFLSLTGCSAQAVPSVMVMRVPGGGIQPQATVDRRGVIHLIYYQGDPGHGDIFYVHSSDGGKNFSPPIRVNSHPGSAIAAGNIRGPQIAVSRNGRVHVAWNGSDLAQPRLSPSITGSPYNSPMLYTRLKDDGSGFEPQRNLMHFTYALDGGGSVAADDSGNVYVAWHAGAGRTADETMRHVWITHSSDDGRTFSREVSAWNQPTGACGCCGIKIFCDSQGAVYILYRSAIEKVHRDIYLLTSHDHGRSFTGERLDRWEIEGCPMSSESFAQGPEGVFGAWETRGQVRFASLNRPDAAALSAPGSANRRKYPVLATNARGVTLFAWTEGMNWGSGGAAAWQLYDAAGHPIPGATGRVGGVPASSLVAVFARPNGGFTLVY